METKTSTSTYITLPPNMVADLGLTIPTTLTKQMEDAILNLPCVPGFDKFPEPYKKSAENGEGFPVGTLLLHPEGGMFVVRKIFPNWYYLTAIIPSGIMGRSIGPTNGIVHDQYVIVGQQAAL